MLCNIGVRIGLMYFVVASTWVISTDFLWASKVAGSTSWGIAIQTAKGLSFIAFSAFLIGWLVQREVSRLKETQSELRKSQKSLQDMFECHPLPLWIYDAETLRFLAVNSAATASYGYSKEEVLRMTVGEIAVHEDLPGLRRALADSSSSRRSKCWRHRLKNGQEIYVDIFTHSVNYQGREARLVAAVDVTGQTEARDRLVLALESAAYAEQSKSNLLSTVSHELKSPLHAILGLSQLVLSEFDETSVRKEDIEAIHEQATLMEEHVSRLIEAAALDEPSNPTAGEVKIAALCTELARHYAPICEVKGLSFSFEENGVTASPVEADPSAVRKILLNLLSNSLKFTETGGIKLRLEQLDQRVKLSVEDTGIGIPTEETERIFEAFTQVDCGLNRRFSGCGLGLFLARELAVRMGVQLELEWSQVGVGSCFSLVIPIRVELSGVAGG